MASIYYAPFRIVKKTNLWMPVVALILAMICGGMSAMKARNASLLEDFGVVVQGVVTDRERRESRDSDGDVTVSYYVSYRFAAGGEVLSYRRRVGSGFYNSVRVDQALPVRYLPDRPTLHEYEIGSYRREATELAGFAGLAGVAMAGLLVWIAARSGPLFRALRGGEVRRAEVTEHVRKPGRGNSGGRYGRLRWRDERGDEGESGVVPMLDVVSHPVGSRIRVVIDPKTRRSYWEEELAGGSDGMESPFG